MLPRPMFIPSLILLVLGLEAAAYECYWRNGGIQLNTDYRQCRYSTTCCAVWDDCLDNGLCRIKTNTASYWRESCTQSDWDAGGCQDICSTNGDDQKNDVRVTPCDGTANSTTWCCGETSDCCNDPSSRVTVAPVFVGLVTTPSNLLSCSSTASTQSTSASQTNASSASTTSSLMSTSTPSNTSDRSNTFSRDFSTGAKAGIGVGAALGVIALVALGWFVGKRSHKKKKGSNAYVPESRQPLPPKYELQAVPPGELAGDRLHLHEMSSHRGE